MPSQVGGTGRLSERDQAIWKGYTLGGKTLMALAEEHNVSNQRISQIIKAIRAKLPEADRQTIIDARLEQIKAIGDALMPDLLQGDKDAVSSWTKIVEREAKYLGLDTASRVELSGGVRYEIEGLPSDAPAATQSDSQPSSVDEDLGDGTSPQGPSEAV